MKIKYLNIIIFAITVFSAMNCARIRYPENFKSIINKQNFKELEGTYKNLSISHNESFWERFPGNKSANTYRIITDSSSVFKIKFLNDRKVKFELYIEDELKLEETKEFVFKKKGIAIKGMSNYRSRGIPLVLYHFESQALWMSKDNDKELFLLYNGSIGSGIFLIGFGAPLLGERRFAKISDKVN